MTHNTLTNIPSTSLVLKEDTEEVLTKAQKHNTEVRSIIDDLFGFINSIVTPIKEALSPIPEPDTTINQPLTEPILEPMEPIATIAIEQELEQEAIETPVTQPTDALTCVVGQTLKERFWSNSKYLLFTGDKLEALEVLRKIRNPQFFVKNNGANPDKAKLFVPRHLFHLLKGATTVQFTSLPIAA